MGAEARAADRPRYREALASLIGAQKSSVGVAAYARYVNRPVGRRVAALAHTRGMSPTQATVISALLSAAGITLLAVVPPSWWQGLLVALLLASGYVMDSVDGQLARLRGGGTLSGEWLDHTIDAFKNGLLHLAVLVCWYRFPPVDSDLVLLVPLTFDVVVGVYYFCIILMPYLRRAGPDPVAAPSGSAPVRENPWRTWLLLPIDYGFVCWTFALLAWPRMFLTVYTALAVLNLALLAVGLRKWWRELQALDRRR